MTNRDTAVESPLVLIANDQEWSARSLESILAPNGYRVIRAFTGQQALERARTAAPDLIILDAQMPDIHGFDVCRTLRDDALLGATTPVIITTSGPSGRAQRLEAYRAGAWEFLGQPLDGEALLLKLRTFIQAKLETDAAREGSLLDAATGLYNMRGLARRARELGAIAARRHEPLACVVLAADGDGESAGQAILKAGRASDALGRLAAGEFAVIAPATGEDGARKLVDRLGRSVAQDPLDAGAEPIQLRAGFSAVPDFAESEVDAVELLLRATTALRDLRRDGGAERIRKFAAAN